ncbi:MULTISPECIES: TusE/DsrC/DsvC family sulfur relay protein [unclassified Halomonas]|uniref:TusE/DsrC/DsvC family sulfur relay protein n=1 Tax=unclassified Halomonas TaxID=2609666 RepID=UPI001EF6B197|nr:MULTISPECIES: TusE/DsrC/DsvC family sulfur relay protein [unclassified Halomonas]MCG7575247.1 TusE/DsrC/DsvC family sulfur relay protein [Halomonas sp. MMH1-48]MCG7602309.1 TusE/DsrC/DsvC family sulfur relay protein [Halomonas sp. MM17-34]MCG7611933.1 TusE/DsrC/DsvC family sulfur relay protein [Halomonas sp. MM17-29]MCG7618814.1 TusE/DsrC/DsvC family sulfur relay protein [Halomonas sp. DSH1-27]
MNDTSLYRYLNANKKVQIDPEGYLVKQSDWDDGVAALLAADEGLALTEEHWELIRVVRDFYTRYEMAPAMRPLVKATKQALGEEKGRSVYLMRLFPGSPPKRLARIAGLPKPTNCL